MLKLKDETLFKSAAYVNGAWSKGGKTFAVTNPSTGEKLADVADLSGADTRAAIDAAHDAFPAWKKKTAKERAALLRKWFELIMASRSRKRAARSPMARPSSNGSPKKVSVSMAM